MPLLDVYKRQVLSYALSVLMITISRKVVYRMRKDVFDKMLALPAGYYDLHQTGDIISRISYDIDTVNAVSYTHLSTNWLKKFISSGACSST